MERNPRETCIGCVGCIVPITIVVIAFPVIGFLTDAINDVVGFAENIVGSPGKILAASGIAFFGFSFAIAVVSFIATTFRELISEDVSKPKSKQQTRQVEVERNSKPYAERNAKLNAQRESQLYRTQLSRLPAEREYSKPGDLNVSTDNLRSLPKLESPAGYVYLMQEIEFSNYYKIGCTNDPATRSSMVDLKTPGETKVIAILKSPNHKALESHLHTKYARNRKQGEWFDLTGSQVREICNL